MTEESPDFGARPIKAPKLSKKARAGIERIMRWEDDSYRAVMGEEPPHALPPRPVRRRRPPAPSDR